MTGGPQQFRIDQAKVEEVLTAHTEVPCSHSTPARPTTRWSMCAGCDWVSTKSSDAESREAEHRSHVAEMIVRALS